MELLKLLSASEVFAQIVTFLILVYILKKLMWNRFIKILDDRKEKISSEFRQIEDEKVNAKKIKEDYEVRIKSIDDAAKAKIAEAVNQGEKLAEDLKKNAQEDAQKIINKAKETIGNEIAKVKEDLRKEMADMVLDAAERILEEKITGEEDRKLVNKFLDEADKLS